MCTFGIYELRNIIWCNITCSTSPRALQCCFKCSYQNDLSLQQAVSRHYGRHTNQQGQSERATFESESIISFLTRFGEGGKSSIRKIVPPFVLLLSANASIVTRTSADTTHPLFYHPIYAPVIWARAPAHYS